MPVQHELGLLIPALEAAKGQSPAFTTNETEFRTINDALEECYSVLEDLTILQKRFDNSGPEIKSALEEVNLDEKELKDVRVRLGVWTSKLKCLNTKIDR